MSIFNPEFTKKVEGKPAAKPAVSAKPEGKPAEADPEAVDPKDVKAEDKPAEAAKAEEKPADPKAAPEDAKAADPKALPEAKPLPKAESDDASAKKGDGADKKADPKADPKADQKAGQKDGAEDKEGEKAEGKDAKGKNGGFGKNDDSDKDIVVKYDGVDFSKLSKEKCFSIIVECLIEIKKLRKSLEKSDAENIGFYRSSDAAVSAQKTAESKIEYLARKLSPTYNQATIDNSNHKYTADELVDLILRDVLENRRALVEKVISLNTETMQDKHLLDELKKQLASALSRKNQAVAASSDVDIKPSDIDEHMAQSGLVETAVAGAASVPSEPDPHGIVIVSVDLDEARASLGDAEYDAIEIMGKLGLSLYPEIEAKLMRDKGYTESKIKGAFARLETSRIVETDLVKTARVKRGVRITELTAEIGRVLFKEKFGQPAVQSEKSRVIADHDNLVHGYSIMEIAGMLKDFGYTSVTTGRKENSMPVGDNKYWIPDVAGVNPTDGKKEYFEVEFGNHNNDNFEDKLVKANLKARILHFIVPNDLVKDKIRQKVENWKAGLAAQNNKSSMEVTIGTIDDLGAKTFGLKLS